MKLPLSPYNQSLVQTNNKHHFEQSTEQFINTGGNYTKAKSQTVGGHNNKINKNQSLAFDMTLLLMTWLKMACWMSTTTLGWEFVENYMLNYISISLSGYQIGWILLEVYLVYVSLVIFFFTATKIDINFCLISIYISKSSN